MSANGEKLRDLRVNKGMSQEKLAVMSDVNRRTIQRAERGGPIAIETLANIAAALEVDISDIRSRQLELFRGSSAPRPKEPGQVILLPKTSGRELVELGRNAISVSVEYLVEPTAENLPNLKEFANVVKKLDYDAEDTDFDNILDDIEALELSVECGRIIEELLRQDVAVYASRYASEVGVVGFDHDTHQTYRHLSNGTEVVSRLAVIVGPTSDAYHSRYPSNHKDAEIPF